MMDSNKEHTKQIAVIGIGRRMGALLIDMMIVIFFGILLAVFVGIIFFFLDILISNQSLPIDRLIYISMIILSILYYVIGWSRTGQTVGKAGVGIKVVGRDGNPPSLGKAFLRYIGYYISALIAALGFLWVGIDSKRQGWHDKLAGTYVVHVDSRFSETDNVQFVPGKKTSWVWYLLWVLMVISMPFGLVLISLAVGPYIGAVLVDFLSSMR
jgi:uncharacterized RDD family membrane protein YckC